MERKKNSPFFMDVTLRDGNQALRSPWNYAKKKTVFHKLLDLGVQGIEVGFAAASKSDFVSCQMLSEEAPAGVVISSLSRAVKAEIMQSWEAIKNAPEPRLHIVLPSSRFTIDNVLQLPLEKVMQMAYESVAFAKNIMDGKGAVQFSAEHFGDCIEDMEMPLKIIFEAIKAGADVINLPNTVERYRPFAFVEMVKQVRDAIPDKIILSVHNHNDMGMATATTVESFFVGATQLEVSLNGLGERAGNTSLYEVACVLYNCGVTVPIEFKEIFNTAQIVSELSGIPIHEKAPLLGEEVVSHRSGIHQDGAAKTMNLAKGAYRAFEYKMIGRKESDRLEFTSQSGKTAIREILQKEGMNISKEAEEWVKSYLKDYSAKMERSLNSEEIIAIAKEYATNINRELK